ncbi:MAG: flavin monoamine oxidase family protein, partial [Phycicoccus sp.]
LALAGRLGPRIHLGTPVRSIEQDDRGITAVTDAGRWPGDVAVITLPLGPLRRVGFDPDLPGSLRSVIERVHYGQMMKVPMQVRRRLWPATVPMPDKSLPGGLGVLYEPTNTHPGPRGVLMAYIPGDTGIELAARDAPGRIDATIDKAERRFPGLSAEVERAHQRWWGEDTWSQGIYAAFPPGVSRAERCLLRRPHGRVLFAGEHTAQFQGYMNGAIESGHQVAWEVSGIDSSSHIG